MRPLCLAALVAFSSALALPAPATAQHIDIGPGGVRVDPRPHQRPSIVEDDDDGHHARRDHHRGATTCIVRTERVWDERDHHWVTRRVRTCED